ncbi:DapH/DapD/GlmU-related protein [Mahella sp.]|uniref:DapH/DapD/GlmU-related protein n=1 Tax=Mahella sp. TaxID=2798721 RepID=UPI0025BC478B|nr:DapH/DapD/GlmU-related protein [Mahella sp.]MBZ4666105.1 sugar O-acyltransferase, sialic acid O-acetyltransferase NeuD family [Mahella sp.]
MLANTAINVRTKICGVSIGRCSHVGAGATILQGIKIGENVTIGAGAVVIRDIPDGAAAVDVPARILVLKEE